MLIIDAFQLKFKESILELLQEERAKGYSESTQKYVALSLKYLATTFPDVGLAEFTGSPISAHSGDGKVFLNTFLLNAAIHAAYLDIYYPNEFHDQEKDPSPDRHAAAVMAWLNRYKPLQVRSSVCEDWAIFINSFLALHVGLTIKLKMTGKIGVAQELIAEIPNINDMIYVLHWRSPDFKYLTTLIQLIGGRSAKTTDKR